jgi:putative DNA primase/helicase
VILESGRAGWQNRKPVGFRVVPYFPASSDPFNSEGPLYWPEGEKDVETLAAAGLPAFTFGGAGDGELAGCEEFVRDRDVVIPADNDEAGRGHAERKAALAARVAKSVRVIYFHELTGRGLWPRGC